MKLIASLLLLLLATPALADEAPAEDPAANETPPPTEDPAPPEAPTAEEAPASAEAPAAVDLQPVLHAIDLVDGTTLVGVVVSQSQDTILLRTPTMGELAIALELVRAVRIYDGPAVAMKPAAPQIQPPQLPPEPEPAGQRPRELTDADREAIATFSASNDLLRQGALTASWAFGAPLFAAGMPLVLYTSVWEGGGLKVMSDPFLMGSAMASLMAGNFMARSAVYRAGGEWTNHTHMLMSAIFTFATGWTAYSLGSADQLNLGAVGPIAGGLGLLGGFVLFQIDTARLVKQSRDREELLMQGYGEFRAELAPRRLTGPRLAGGWLSPAGPEGRGVSIGLSGIW